MLDMKRVGKNIKAARAKKNMTQLELADIVGVSYQAVSNWERGNTMPDITKIPDIAKALDIKIEDILGDEKKSKAVSKVVEEKQELLTTEEITDIAPILPPQIIKENINNSERDNKLNIKALVELAPYLDEEFLDDLIKEIDVTQIKELVELAPYLSEDALMDIARRLGTTDAKDIVDFAPYLPDEAFTEIASKLTITNIEDLVELAPYMPEEALDEFVKKTDDDKLEELEDIVCYLSEETLDAIADKAISSGKVKSIVKFAPYFEDNTLRKIADYFLHSKDTSGLSEIAQYM